MLVNTITAMSYLNGARLRQMRELRRMTLSDVSTATGVSRAQISLIENGKADPRISTVVKILSCYGRGLADLEPTPIEVASVAEILMGAERGAQLLESVGLTPSDPEGRLDWKQRHLDVGLERSALATRS
jgi:transcriptional regulator with XRE-family HTH domain